MGSGSGQKSKGAAFHAVKYTFIGFNVLIWLLGFGVLTVGIWMHLNQAPYSSLLPNSSFLGATVITICAGALLFIVGFTGCCGAILESQCMLITYFTFVLVIFGLEVAATSVCLTHKTEIEGYLREEVMLSLYRDYKQELVGTPTGGVVAVVDNIQTNFECCGVDNHTDWYNLPEWPLKDNVPTSCCVHQYEGCGEAGSQAVLYSKGCLEEVRYWLLKNMYTLGMLALGLAVLQVLTMTAAVAMFCCLRKTSPHF
ncbi:tetraspanin-4-like [Mya arenaria]|uniref:tetraspanin-4-like n=1 Tax=Mya arenaria TaxID=6604 RepID=UPI0022E93130|nr:tetraspanin-4-like [Mya arenaria]